MTNHYELLYIVSIKYTGDDLQKAIETVNQEIKNHQGEITSENIIGKQRLAYPIKKIHQGTYIAVEFNMPREKVKSLDSKLKINNHLLRHLLIVKRQKTAQEIAHEQKIQERLLKKKEEELAKTENMLLQNTNETVSSDSINKASETNVKEEKNAQLITKETETTEEVEIKSKKKKSKVSLEELDKKLDEILTDDII